MTLPDSKIQTDITERPLASKRRASDGADMLDINLSGINVTVTPPFVVTDNDGTKANVEARSQTPTKNNALQVQIGPGDIISNLPVVIEFDHHQIHEGEMWQWFWFGDLNSTTKDVRISIPALTATKGTPHLIPEVVSDCTATQVLLYEGTTWTVAGTNDSTRIMNRNRNIAGSPGTKVYVAGATALTVNAVGTQIYHGYLFATARGSLASDRTLAEWDLKTSTEYLLRVTTTGNGKVLIRLNWYEDLGV